MPWSIFNYKRTTECNECRTRSRLVVAYTSKLDNSDEVAIIFGERTGEDLSLGVLFIHFNWG